MAEAKHHESKKKSQLDRLLNFSDGVFAIAITLLIIEIAVPTITKFTDEELWKQLSKMLLKFMGFLISFAVVGYYQVVHHRIFGYVQRSNAKLLDQPGLPAHGCISSIQFGIAQPVCIRTSNEAALWSLCFQYTDDSIDECLPMENR